MSNKVDITEKIYDFLSEDGEPRACDEIPEEACTNLPKNFTLNVLNGTSTKLAEQIISPGLTLPWILSFLGAPDFFSGLLVPVKNAGSLFPQLLVSAKIRAYEVRKYFWAVAALVQAICMLLMGFTVYVDDGITAGWLIVILLLIFSISSGVASVAFKDVVAKTIPKGRRGQMLAMRASFGGVFSLLAGLVLYFFVGENAGNLVYFFLFAIAASLWAMASVLFFNIQEEPGYTDGGRSPVHEITQGGKLLREDGNLRKFVMTRALLMAIPLATPFYVLIGREEVSDSLAAFGLLIITNGLANIASSPFWGRFSDRSSRKMMIITAILGAVTAVYAISVFYWPEGWRNMYLFLPVLFLNGMAHAGARLSRKTYLVDYAPEEERPLYVSLSNTLIGLFTLIAAGLGFVADLFSLQAQILLFMGMMIGSAILGFRLKEI